MEEQAVFEVATMIILELRLRRRERLSPVGLPHPGLFQLLLLQLLLSFFLSPQLLFLSLPLFLLFLPPLILLLFLPFPPFLQGGFQLLHLRLKTCLLCSSLLCSSLVSIHLV